MQKPIYASILSFLIHVKKFPIRDKGTIVELRVVKNFGKMGAIRLYQFPAIHCHNIPLLRLAIWPFASFNIRSFPFIPFLFSTPHHFFNAFHFHSSQHSAIQFNLHIAPFIPFPLHFIHSFSKEPKGKVCGAVWPSS
jgi:hypothetical protein